MKIAHLISLSFLMASSAIAGGSVGNGGVAVVIRDAKGKIESARLLDLVESETLYGPSVADCQDETVCLGKALARFTKLTGSAARTTHLAERIRAIRASPIKDARYGLPRPEDFRSRIRLKRGEFEVIGLFIDEEATLYLDPELLASLSILDRTAFYIHEALYQLARENGQTDSDSARVLVGLIFRAGTGADEARKKQDPALVASERELFADLALHYRARGGQPRVQKRIAQSTLKPLQKSLREFLQLAAAEIDPGAVFPVPHGVGIAFTNRFIDAAEAALRSLNPALPVGIDGKRGRSALDRSVLDAFKR
jgi:hypothetical protein